MHAILYLRDWVVCTVRGRRNTCRIYQNLVHPHVAISMQHMDKVIAYIYFHIYIYIYIYISSYLATYRTKLVPFLKSYWQLLMIGCFEDLFLVQNVLFADGNGIF